VNHLTSVELGEDFLAHYGVKGMHWGIRKAVVDLFKNERKTYQDTMSNPRVARQVRTARNVAIGMGVGLVGLAAVGGLATHMQTNPAPYIRAATYMGNAARSTMNNARRATTGSRVIFSQAGKMTYYPPGAGPPIRPNFDPNLARRAINVAPRALNP